MPRKPRVPSYLFHKPTGQAYVRLPKTGGGRQSVYLGKHGSARSTELYNRVIADYLTGKDAANPDRTQPRRDLLVAEVMVHFLRWATKHYVKDGEPTTELNGIKNALCRMRESYGHSPANEFGPRALKSLRESMIADGLARTTINKEVNRIRRMFKWAASEELVNPSIWHGLAAVTGLQQGRSDARETEPIRPVADAIVEAACEHLPVKLAAMVRLQRLLGCRPHEVCQMRIGDVDRSEEQWQIIPGRHKTQHHGHDRVIFVGPKAQTLLATWLGGPGDRYVFESRRGRCYTSHGYGHAVERACVKAGVAHWSPNQLRHSRATELRREFNLETASAVLGHAGLKMTEVYAEKNQKLAIEAARRSG